MRNGRLLVLLAMLYGWPISLTWADEEDNIHLWVQNGNVEKVKAILAKNPKLVNSKGRYNSTPLELAATGGRMEIVKVLLEAGAEMDAVSAAALGSAAELGKILKDKPWLAKPPNKPLHAAARRGDRKCVELLLAFGADPNLDYGFSNVLGPYTPLSNAVTAGHYEVTKLLLEHGAKTDVSGGKNHDSLFHRAVGYSDIRIVKAMLGHRADVDSLDHWGLTPLHVAVEIGNLDKVKLLVANRANVNATTRDEATPLFFAAVRGHRLIADYLLTNGAQLDIYSACALGKRAEATAMLKKDPSLANRRDKRLQRTPLFWAAYAGDATLLQLLLDRGATVNVSAGRIGGASNVITGPKVIGELTAQLGETPLHVAAAEGHVEVARLLIRRGAKLDALDEQNYAPLHRACERNQLAVVKLLLEEKADPTSGKSGSLTPLHLATAAPGIVAALLDAGADPNAASGGTPLFWAAYSGHSESVKLMLRRARNVDFHTACLLGRMADVKKMLGADRKLLDQPLQDVASEWTPLQLAARAGQVEVAKYLLDQGAALDPPGSRNPTPIHLAAMHGRKEVVELLLTRGISPDAAMRNGPTVLAYAVDYAQLEIVRLLLDKGANVNAPVDHWVSALHRIGHETTAWGPHTECIGPDRIKREVEIARLLLDHGARLEVKNTYGETPLHEATAQGQAELVALYLEHGAKVNEKDANGSTPLYKALHPWRITHPGRDHARTAEILRKHGGVE